MKIKNIKISNVLSFEYFENIDKATEIILNGNLNILIGENGAGKSTTLEVMNFVFKRVLFTQFNVNQDLYLQKNTLSGSDKKNILAPANNNSYTGFRLEPNWNTENETQKIKLEIELDQIDIANIDHLIANKEKLDPFYLYTNHSINLVVPTKTSYSIEITLNGVDKNFSIESFPDSSDSGYQYLVNYNFYKELINLHNLEKPQDPITPLHESFTLIGGYRNYNAFNSDVSLQTSSAAHQIQQIKISEFSKSLNSNEQSEPAIFNLVRLRVAKKHYEIYGEDSTGCDCEAKANSQDFLSQINKRLRLVNLEVKIEFTDKQKWAYSFKFHDLKRNKPLANINSLSAGQKAIIHLVFEAYGRGDLKGGLVIIDEPEIHLHYQFQNEYLRVIEEINSEQNCQYILVTHSESLINSVTIHKVKRFALDSESNTTIKSPVLSANQKLLIKILDNTRSTYAFFAKKIILVEGDTDRYFLKSVIQELKPELTQEIAVLDITGKANYSEWKDLFEAFGLPVYFLGDLDSAFNFLYPTETFCKINLPTLVTSFKSAHPDLETRIEAMYADKIFILKNGDLEHYLGIHNKGLPETIKFCNDKLTAYLKNDPNKEAKEIKAILDEVVK